MNEEAMIKITEPEVVSKIESIENGATGVITYNYDKSHIYYKGIDLGSFEELLNVKKYITDLQKKAELGEHYKYLYSEVKKQKYDVVEYINFLYIINQNINGKFSDTLWGKEILELLGEIDE